MNNSEARTAAEALIAQGYLCVSRNHRVVARIDRPNWKQVLRDRMGPSALLATTQSGVLEDFYRRCYSQDKLTVDSRVLRLIPSSSFDPTGYVAKAKLQYKDEQGNWHDLSPGIIITNIRIKEPTP